MNLKSIDILKEIKELLHNLTSQQFVTKLEILNDSSIGQHVRHILEFYQCLFKSHHTKEVNYDARQRDLKLESDIDFALKTVDEILEALMNIKGDFRITFVANFSTDDNQEPTLIQSTFYRELAYNLEHSIHHQALIKVAITEMQLTFLVKETFGYAPSTIRNSKICAQ